MNDRLPTRDELDSKMLRFFLSMAGFTVVVLVLFALLWGPVMRPWTQERLGTARLAQAKYDNLIRAEAAKAEEDAAVLRAQAIAIVGEVAKQYPEYRAQEFIGGFAIALESGTIDQTFYIPTRNSIPLLPAFGIEQEQE